ncbi:MAG: hypothetical protein AAF995_01000 [Planctomycetota bacterium]
MTAERARRGLQDIRTLAGRPSGPGQQQRLFMRLCTLEIERARQAEGKRVAAQRAQVAAERLDKLDTEITEILEQIGQRRGVSGAVEPKPQGAGMVHRYGPGAARQRNNAS